MSGVNTGILINAYPLTAEQIAEVEAKVFTANSTYAFLSDKRELCFAFPWGVDNVKELAWHQAWELSIEDSLYVKRIYKKKSQREYYLWKTLYKNSLDEPWPDDPEMTQLDPAEITLDGDILNIFDASGLATSATIFVNGIPMHTVEIKGEAKEPLDPTFNHYGVIPEGCWLDIQDADGFHNYYAGDSFPTSYDGINYCEYSDNGVKYWYAGTPDYEYYDRPVGVGWEMFALEQECSSSEIKVLESIDGMPVHAITGVWEYFFGQERITSITIPKSVTYICFSTDAGGTLIGLPSLASITYLGTKADWNNITFAENWNYDCPEITVTCTDGTITVPAYNS